jgi:hypothetical protein
MMNGTLSNPAKIHSGPASGFAIDLRPISEDKAVRRFDAQALRRGKQPCRMGL